MPLFVPKDRKSLFRQFLSGMYDAVVITDPNGHILELNPRAEEHFLWSQDEVTDRPISSLVPGISVEVVQRLRGALSEDRHVMIDASCLRKDATRFAAEVAVSTIDLLDPDDLVFTIRNVERRRKVNEMLRAKEGAFNLAPVALFACDPTGRFTLANPTFLEMFDVADEEALREHVFADFLADEPLDEDFRQALAGESTSTALVADGEAGDRSEVEVSLAPYRTTGSKIRGVVGSIQRK